MLHARGIPLVFILLILSTSACTNADIQAMRASGGGAVGSAWSLDGKCNAVLVWMGKIHPEYPNTPVQRVNVAHPGVPNLLRQKYFVPVFGMPYSYQNAAALKAINDKILYQCYGFGTFRKYASEVGPYKQLFDTIFVMSLQGHAYGGIKLLETVSNLESVEAWMEDTLKTVPALPLAEKSFSELDSRLTEGTNKLTVLFPSEQKAFVSAMTQSKTNMARALLAKLDQEMEGLEPSLTNARKIKTEMVPNATLYRTALGGPAGSDPGQKFSKKLESIVNQLVQERVAVLKAVPDTEEGLKPSEQWYRKFDEDLSPFKEFSSVTDALAILAKRRDSMYRAAKPAFLFSLNSLEPKYENISRTDSLLQQSFALPNDLVLPVYKDYEKAVYAKKEQIVAKLVNTKLGELRALPVSLDSAVGILQWRKELEQNYGSFRSMTPINSAFNEYMKKREEILKGSSREFVQKQQALPISREGLRQSVEMLDTIFPKLEDEQLPIYRQYKTAVLSRIVSIRSKMR